MSGTVESVLKNFEGRKQEFLSDLIELARIPSISFEGYPKQNVVRSAEATAELFKKRGLENVEVLYLKDAHPYVYADWLHAPGQPTLLLYAHHDVQPVGREHLWKTAPFEPTEKNGRLYGRGTADDKAGIVIHTSAVAAYLETFGKLPVNVKFIIEGEEEAGSQHLEHFLKKYKEKLMADAIVLTDTGNYDSGLPSITVALRGLVAFDIEVKALKQSVHSGMMGGAIPDAAMALCKILTQMVDSQGRVAIPGVWDQVKPLSERQQKEVADLPLTLAEFRQQTGLLPNVHLLPSRDGTLKPLVQTWYEPAFSINAIEASSRKAAANIINDSAWARFGIRLAQGMDPQKTVELVKAYIKKITPWGVEVSLKEEISGPAWSCEARGPAFESAMRALEKGYGKKPVLFGAGGSIPFVGPFANALGGVPALLIGVEDPYSNPHSENESMLISDFYKSIASAIYFYEDFARTCQK